MRRLVESLTRCMGYDGRIGLPLAMLDFERDSTIDGISTDGRCILYDSSSFKAITDNDLDLLLLHVWLSWTRGWIGKTVDGGAKTIVANYAAVSMFPSLKPSTATLSLDYLDATTIQQRITQEELYRNRCDWYLMIEMVEKIVIDGEATTAVDENVDGVIDWSGLRPCERLKHILRLGRGRGGPLDSLGDMPLPLLAAYEFVISK